jgi:hypothetical protein
VRAAVTVLVVVGVLIVFGFIGIGVKLYTRLTDPPQVAATAVTAAPAPVSQGTAAVAEPPAPPGPPRETVLDLPAGARIAEIISAGNRAIFRVIVPKAGERLYVLDPVGGNVTAVITAQPAEAVP